MNIEIPEEHLSGSFLRNICNSSSEVKFFQQMFRAMKKRGRGKNTWDSVGLYYHRIKNSLSIIPRINLTSNIGITGFHALGKTKHHFRPVDEDFVVKKHPESVECFIDYDKHHFNTYFNKKSPLLKRILKKLKRTFI